MNKTPPGPDTEPRPEPGNPVLDLIFYRIPMAIIGVLILIGIGINFSNVVGRYAFGHAIFWTEEVLIFIIVWSVFIGMIAISYKGGHLKMDLLSEKLGSPWKEIINGSVIVTFILSGIFVMVQSFKVVSVMGRTGVVSNAAEIPMSIPHTALLVGMVLTVLAVVIRIRCYFRGKFDD